MLPVWKRRIPTKFDHSVGAPNNPVTGKTQKTTEATVLNEQATSDPTFLGPGIAQTQLSRLESEQEATFAHHTWQHPRPVPQNDETMEPFN